MKGIFILILMVLVKWNSANAVIGDFSETRNLPGYIDLNPDSKSYRGPYARDLEIREGVIQDTPSELVAKFMANERVDTAKIRQVVTDVLRFQENARITYCQVKLAEAELSQKGCKQGFPNAELESKWKRKNTYLALNYVIQRFEEAIDFASVVTAQNINQKPAQNFLEAFFDGFEIYQSVVGEDVQLSNGGAISRLLRPFRNLVKPSIIRSGRMEASNLMKDAGSGGDLYYSPSELEEMKQAGVDISLLNPPDSGFWRQPKKPISEYDTSNYNKEEMDYFTHSMDDNQIAELLDSDAPISVSYKLQNSDVGGETPKLFVNYGNTLFKVKFTTDRMGSRRSTNVVNEGQKIVRGMEVNTETVANNLAAALGFSVDGTYHKNIVKLFFNDEVYENDLFDQQHKKMMELFDENYSVIYNASSALKFVKVDPASGRKYIELKNVQLERGFDVDTDMHVGFFTRKGLGKELKREHRGFVLFLAWLWDTDTKDANTGLKLIPYQDERGQLRYKMVFANSDMGATLSSNKPNFFNFRLVRDVRRDEQGKLEYMKLNFWRIYPLDLMEVVTFADAKWMARLIAQLTPEQIMRATIAAGYPDIIAKYYTGLLLKKRNQLLSALGMMGETFTSSTGQTITITPTEEFTGTIEGYEEFFRDGFLTDPENRLFDPTRDHYPRYWGASIKNFKGEPQEHYIKLLKFTVMATAGKALFRYGLKDISISNAGLNFRGMNLRNTELARDCAGKCFYQGFQVGVQGFVPWRFLVDNPDPDAESPFWVVDLFRLGFFAGANVQQNFGVSIPGAVTMGLSAQHTQMSEFIKIRPVTDLEEFFNSKPNPFTGPKLDFQTAKDTMFRNLKEGDALIQSHYIGNAAEAEVRMDFGSYMPLTPSVTFGVRMLTANRVTFMGREKSQIYAAWENLADVTGRIAFNIRAAILRIPLMVYELKKLRSHERTFKFDVSIPEDREILRRSMNRLVPSEIPAKYALKQRLTRTNQRSFTLGFFQFFRRRTTQRSIRVDYQDYIDQSSASNLTYEKVTSKNKTNRYFGVHSTDYKVLASMDSRHSLFAKVKFLGSFDHMTRIYFKNLLYNFSPLLPKNFVQFDPDSVKDNFGRFELNVETIFSEKGLRDAFHPEIKKFGMCKVYSKLHNFEWTDDICQRLSNMRFMLFRGFSGSHEQKRFVQFWRSYEIARNNFWDFINNRAKKWNDSRVTGILKSIVEALIDTGRFDYQAMNLFASLSKPNHYYRRISMISGHEAFPGGYDTIIQDVDAAGSYVPSIAMLSDSPEEEFELFTDIIHDAIGDLFWNRDGALSIMPQIDRI